MKNKNNVSMENTGPKIIALSYEEQIEKEYQEERRNIRISHMRSSVIRRQITEAYGILENIRFDYLGDTAFREKVVNAKINLEKAFGDFLLSNSYWEEKIERLNNMNAEDFYQSKQNNGQPTQN
jgi:hypothetical protein